MRLSFVDEKIIRQAVRHINILSGRIGRSISRNHWYGLEQDCSSFKAAATLRLLYIDNYRERVTATVGYCLQIFSRSLSIKCSGKCVYSKLIYRD